MSHQPATLPCLHFRLPPYHHPLIIPLLRRLLRERQAKEVTAQLVSSLSERAVTRTTHAIFNVNRYAMVRPHLFRPKPLPPQCALSGSERLAWAIPVRSMWALYY